MLDHPDLPPGVRTYGPSDVMDDFHIHEVEDEILAVRTKIERIYSGLPPAIHKKRSFEMGFCFGLLDPRSNIIVNSIIMDLDASRDPLPPAGGGGREDVSPRARGVKRGRKPLTPVQKLARRSLTAFLTCLFPYLPDAEARRYLDFAGADPLVAALLIIRRRHMVFDCSSQTTKAAVEVALRCAAVAADHPNPQRFVMGWKLVSTPAMEALVPVSFVTPKGLQGNLIFGAPEGIKSVEKTAAQDTLLLSDVSWESARARFEPASPEIHSSPNVLPPTRAHMKRMLLAKIHGFYIDALGRLPKVELCSCYHRSMLIGGYCYGPLDPISNIILNTIWYERHFPQSKQFQVTMISTQLLWRIAARSLYGLISFLCTIQQRITPDQAIECLLTTSVYLPAAVKQFPTWPPDTTPLLDTTPLFSDSPMPLSFADAYAAAGAASFHCSPRALSEFLTSNIALEPCIFPQSIQYGHSLSSEEISSICTVIENYSSSSGTCQQQDVARTKVKKWEYAQICRRSDSFWGQHDRVTSMVRDALDRFNMTLADGQQFVLHIIFGVNEFVSGPVRSTNGKVGKYNPWTNDIYCRSHINFLARCKDRPLDTPTVFFAECGKDGDDTCWCVPVIRRQRPETEKSRCIYCEHQANRILHPIVEKFHGRDEFDELFYISDRRFYNNDRIITHNGINVDWVHDVSDAAIYLNSYPDDDDDGDEADWIVIY